MTLIENDRGKFVVFTMDPQAMYEQNCVTQIIQPVRRRATKATQSLQSDTTKVGVSETWQFEDGPIGCDRWKPYLKNDARVLSVAKRKNSATCQLKNRFGTYQVRLPAGQTRFGTQINVATKKTRRVRCVPGQQHSPTAATTTIRSTTKATLNRSGTWQFEDGPIGCERWKPYLKSDARTLDVAKRNGSTTCSLKNRFGQYRIKLPSDLASFGSQVNLTTKTTRRVRYATSRQHAPAPIPPSPPSSLSTMTTTTTGYWEWFDNGKWVRYDKRFNDMIEGARIAQQRVLNFTINGQMYIIDFGTQTQRNIRTGRFRNVRRTRMSGAPRENSTSSTKTSTDDSNDHGHSHRDTPPCNLGPREIDCWTKIAPLRAKHNPRLLKTDPLQLIADECQRRGCTFVDRAFPPVKKSANWNESRPSAIRMDNWKRLQELCPSKPQLFTDGADPDDVIQVRHTYLPNHSRQ